MRKIKFLSVLVLLAMLLNAAPIFADSTDPLESRLVDIAKAALTAQNQILVSGDSEMTLRASPLSPAYKSAMQQHFADRLSERRALANHQ